MASPPIAGVIGWPVTHSLSPRLHRYWLDRYGIEGDYRPFAVAPEALREFIRMLPREGYAGANVTVPHKEEALALVDEVDEVAENVGAVNTIVVEGDRLKGLNTDVYGFSENLKRHNGAKQKRKAVVLGAGGAARAVCRALEQEGYESITLVARALPRAEALARRLRVKTELAAWENRAEALEGADLLVNATSLGMQGGEPLDIGLGVLPEQATVTDIVYTPLETPLLKAARERGNQTVDGLGMLLYQAVPGFEAWFGRRPEVDTETRQYMQHDG